jgi:hypothetical protein
MLHVLNPQNVIGVVTVIPCLRLAVRWGSNH